MRGCKVRGGSGCGSGKKAMEHSKSISYLQMSARVSQHMEFIN